MANIEGGCLCGNVRWTATTDPVFQGVCHWRDCQRQGGTSYSVVIAFPASELSVRGNTKTYRGIGTSGNEVLRKFCPDCGSPILSEPATNPGMAFVKGGTLDDTSILAPMIHIWCDSKQNWVTLPDGAMTFPQSPN